jgi:hypothetical protein
MPPVGAPRPGTANVDGDASEWTAGDRFADMTQAGDPGRPVRAVLSLRYDCATTVLYAFVRATGDGEFLANRGDEAYLRIDGAGKLVSGRSGDDDRAPDFRWVGRDGRRAAGWEASGMVAAGRHTIRSHGLLAFDDEDGFLKLDTVPRYTDLILVCDAPSSATAEPTPEPDPSATPTPTAAPGPTPTPSPTPDPSESSEPDDVDDTHDDDTPDDTQGGLIVVLPLLAATTAWATRPDRLRRRTRAR